MKQFDEINHVNNLPDCYSKAQSGNNYKLLQTEKESVDELKKDIEDILNVLDIKKAKGITLDLYGYTVNQQRGSADDKQYYYMIRAKIMRNLSNGDYGSVLKALYVTFNCKPSQVSIEMSETPCTVKFVKAPLKEIQESGLTVLRTVQIIKSLLPVGINIESYFFEGTFEFGAADNEYDEIRGFGNVEQTLGGFLGEFFEDDSFEEMI